MNRTTFLAFFTSVALPLFSPADEFRTFTDVFGQETEARILKVEGGQVYLEQKSGKRLQLPLKSLPAEEQKAVRNWLKPGSKAPVSSPRKDKESPRPKPMKRNADSKPSPSPPDPAVEDDAKSTWLPGEKELYDKALSLKRAGRSDEAVPIAERWLKMREDHYGPDHPETGTALNNIGVIYQDVGRFEDARRVLERSLAIDEAVYGKDHPETAVNMGNLSDLLAEIGDLEKAEKLSRKALGILENAHGDDHPDTATAIGNLALLLSDRGDYDEAEKQYRRVLAIREKALGPDHEAIAGILNNLGVLLWEHQRFAEAESCYLRALKIEEAALGTDHPRVTTTLSNLGTLYGNMGRFNAAEQHFQRALKILESLFGRNHPQTASTVNGLGSLYHRLGQFDRAERLYLRVLKMAEDYFGDNHPKTALALNNLGGVHSSRRQFEEAEDFYRRAFEIHKAVYGPEHPATAGSLNNLAGILGDLGRLEESRELFERALKIREAVFGESPDTALTLQNLAALNEKLGDPEKSIPLYERALRINTDFYGPNHTQTGIVRMNLALLHIVLGNDREAKELAKEITRADESVLSEVLGFTNEQERLAFRKSKLPFTLIGTLGMAPECADVVLRQKGIVLESILEDRKIAAEADPDLVERIRSQRSLLRRLRLTQGDPESKADAIREAEAVLAALEKELARSTTNTGGVRKSLSIKAADIADALPEKTALVEYFQFMRVEQHADDSPEFRYAALIYRNGSEPALVDCAEATKVEVCVRELRKSLVNADLLSLRTGNMLLGEILIDPLRPYLEGVEDLVISPDNQLNFLSFAALFDEQRGKFLAEEFRIHYVAGGRDLVRDVKGGQQSAPTIVGGPAFRNGASKVDENPGPESFVAVLVREVKADDLASLDLPPLPGAKAEARRVKTALGRASRESQLLIGADATESAVRSLKSPKILHLATHGFYLNQIGTGDGEALPFVSEEDSGSYDGWKRFQRSQGTVQNPMYRSGIALAGAQTTFENWRAGRLVEPEGDGILMAAEVADLDLRGTDLVTLSACSTATGEVLSGEGVLGLRRGFIMAGAQNLLMTLWPVADEETADFMEDFYERYAETGDAPKSLAEVQREWLVRLREERGLLHAVNRAGPFIMSSQGRID